VFPHSTSRGTRRLDHDHPTPSDADGPAGQTSDLNDGPLTRRHHRAKTRLGYRCEQIGLGVYRWTTPHGLVRIVGPTGTRKVGDASDIPRFPADFSFGGPRIDVRLVA
jgi:hypothetical protein